MPTRIPHPVPPPQSPPCRVSGAVALGLLAALLLLWSAPAPAATAPSLKELAQRLFPQAEVDSVEPSAISGLYEVRSGRSILYMDGTGRYVLVGELYDFTARKNLTAQRVLSLPGPRFEDLPLASAIRLGPEHGTRRLAIFDDVNCPFCRKFHDEVLPALLQEGVTVYVLLYPITSPQAEAKSQAVWCSADRVAALAAAMRDAPLPTPAEPCHTPLPEIRALGTKLGVGGTPTLILDTGDRIEGFVSHDALLAKWQAARR